MGNVPSAEEGDNPPLTAKAAAAKQGEAANDNSNNNNAQDNQQEQDKAVTFSEPPQLVDPDDEEPPSSPARGLDHGGKSCYFDMVTGTWNEARVSGRRGDLQWRNSNRSVRVLTGDELIGPEPQWKRVLRKLGMSTLMEETTKPKGEEDSQNNNDNDANNDPSASAAAAANLKHFRIQSLAMLQDASSLLLDSGKTANFLSEYLRWTFDRSFLHVMLVTYIQFLFLSIIFAIFILLVDREQPQCIQGGAPNNKDNIYFSDAFQLSWTTLSTVGYGLVYPSLAKVDQDSTRCLGVNVLMAIEAFVGVLFGGVTGAIIFGKIARVQSIASVGFCHPLVIRYGLGVVGTGDHSEYDDNDEDEEEDKKKVSGSGNTNTEVQWPCPVIEFRIVNKMSEEIGGEIRNASINVAACFLERMDESEDYLNLRSSMLGNKKKKKPGTPRTAGGVVKQTGKAILGGSRGAAAAGGNLIQKLHHGLTKPLHHHPAADNGEESKPFNAAQVEREVKEQIARELLDSTFQRSQMVTVDEGNHALAPRRTYTKLDMATDSHPFFKRVWSIKHVLNERSPLLSSTARRMIKQNQGHFPASLNNHEAIRKHVHFEELVVTLSGTSNVSGNSVYGQKVYSYEDLTVGYAFAGMLAKDSSGRVVVDHRLLNDVREQKGGGGEPIGNIHESAAHSAQVVKPFNKDSGELNSGDFWED